MLIACFSRSGQAVLHSVHLIQRSTCFCGEQPGPCFAWRVSWFLWQHFQIWPVQHECHKITAAYFLKKFWGHRVSKAKWKCNCFVDGRRFRGLPSQHSSGCNATQISRLLHLQKSPESNQLSPSSWWPRRSQTSSPLAYLTATGFQLDSLFPPSSPWVALWSQRCSHLVYLFETLQWLLSSRNVRPLTLTPNPAFVWAAASP